MLIFVFNLLYLYFVPFHLSTFGLSYFRFSYNLLLKRKSYSNFPNSNWNQFLLLTLWQTPQRMAMACGKVWCENIKPDRLSWNARSLQEMESWKTRTWIEKEWRILIGVDDSWSLIIEDWRHLLEAYRRSHKNIHIKYIITSIINIT